MRHGFRQYSSHRWLVSMKGEDSLAAVMTKMMFYVFICQHVDFGYDISDYEAIQPEYGTMEDFEELITKAEKLGEEKETE